MHVANGYSRLTASGCDNSSLEDETYKGTVTVVCTAEGNSDECANNATIYLCEKCDGKAATS